MFIASLILVILIPLPRSKQDDRPLSPVQARKMVGETITVEMMVKATKDRLEMNGEIYLDSETYFRDEKNFAIVITRICAARLKEDGIDAPANHFKGKTIRASGEVRLVQGVFRIEIDDARQIRILDQ
jgi:hypothetical protein